MNATVAALLATRIIAIYVAFHAIIYGGEFAHDLLRARPVAVLARSFVPVGALVVLAAGFWMLAPRVARALIRDPGAVSATEQPQAPPDANAIGAIAFGALGLFIASQAAPLFASTIQRLVGGVWNGDATGDVIAATVRIALGIAIFFGSARLADGILRLRRR